MAPAGGLPPKRDRKPTVRFTAGGKTQPPPKPTVEMDMEQLKEMYERKLKSITQLHKKEMDHQRTLRERRDRDYKQYSECRERRIGELAKERDKLQEEMEKWKTTAQVNETRAFQAQANFNEWKSTGDNANLEKMLNEARDQAKRQRDISLGYLASMAKGQEDFSTLDSNLKFCEICTLDYDRSSTVVPRVLPCGHTVCEACIGKLTDKPNNILRCPFDRIPYNMLNRTAKNFPKNFLVLHK